MTTYRANVGNLKTQGERMILEVHGRGRLEADDWWSSQLAKSR